MAKQQVVKIDQIYSYFSKLSKWHNFATLNNIPFNCEKCKKVNAYKTVLLADGSHICWFCWIKKSSIFSDVVSKPKEIIKIKKYKPTKNTSEDKTEKNVVSKKSASKSKAIMDESELKKTIIPETIVQKTPAIKKSKQQLVPTFKKVLNEKTNSGISSDNYFDNVEQKIYEVVGIPEKRNNDNEK